MGKLKHIQIDNLAYLTGLPDAVALSHAKLLDGCVEGAMKNVPAFSEWRRGASYDRLSFGCWNFTFHCLQVGGAEGKPGAMVLAESVETQGGFGEHRRGAYIYLWSQAGDEQQSLISIPLVYLLRDFGSVAGLFTIYEHGAVDYNGMVRDTFTAAVRARGLNGRMFPGPAQPHGENGMLYVGVTSRSWGP
jgi:hypothetical protein